MKSQAQILIVDDQEGIRNLLRETCLVLGYAAEVTDSGQEALRLIENGAYQIAIVDLMMPGLNGVDTIKQLMEKTENLKIIVVTGLNEFEEQDAGITELLANPRVLALLKKPFSLKELQKILEKNISE